MGERLSGSTAWIPMAPYPDPSEPRNEPRRFDGSAGTSTTAPAPSLNSPTVAASRSFVRRVRTLAPITSTAFPVLSFHKLPRINAYRNPVQAPARSIAPLWGNPSWWATRGAVARTDGHEGFLSGVAQVSEVQVDELLVRLGRILGQAEAAAGLDGREAVHDDAQAAGGVDGGRSFEVVPAQHGQEHVEEAAGRLGQGRVVERVDRYAAVACRGDITAYSRMRRISAATASSPLRPSTEAVAADVISSSTRAATSERS